MISPQSNIQEIMAMANTYFYYTAPEDYDAFLSYALKLWESSHSFQYSISEVYDCGGTLKGKQSNPSWNGQPHRPRQKRLLRNPLPPEKAQAIRRRPFFQRKSDLVSHLGKPQRLQQNLKGKLLQKPKQLCLPSVPDTWIFT
jgi:hypothetical protein